MYQFSTRKLVWTISHENQLADTQKPVVCREKKNNQYSYPMCESRNKKDP